MSVQKVMHWLKLDEKTPLTGPMLWCAAIMIAAANFIAILDMTIANVSVPNIAGNLGATNSQGTWVITSYAVAEAITVPLTGWLAARFGSVRVFVSAMILFAVTSALCGLAHSLGFLVAARIFQGLAGGPLMPMSQTLLMKIFPKEKVGAALGLWSMTTLLAPVLGPVLGGYICDEFSWQWIFYINVPVALGCALICLKLLWRYEEPTHKSSMDYVGLGLLVFWVGCLQIMLDEGKELDWFNSNLIIALACGALSGLGYFLIWEKHHPNPIVDLKVFKHRGFNVSVFTISLAFAALFGSNVITPMWLQTFMGYTATLAGFATGSSGLAALCVAPMAALMLNKVDPRKIVFWGIVFLGSVTLWRSLGTLEMSFWDITTPLLIMGLGLPFFFIPLTNLALGSVDSNQTASAAGLMNFLRTLSGAMATSIVTTKWDDWTAVNHNELVNAIGAASQEPETPLLILDQLINAQSVILSTNQLMFALAILFYLAAGAIWLAPRPHKVENSTPGH